MRPRGETPAAAHDDVPLDLRPAKDNRILPQGFLSLAKRTEIALALGANADLAKDVEPHGVGKDPTTGGRRRLAGL